MIKAKIILQLLNNRFGINLASKKRSNEYVFARAIYFKLVGMHTELTLAKQAEVVNRDHATAIHSNRRVVDYVLTIPMYKKIFVECCEILDPMTEMPDNLIITEPNKQITDAIAKLIDVAKKKEKKLRRMRLEPHEVKYRQLSRKDQRIFKQRAEAILKMMG